MKSLVVYKSKTGYSKKYAEWIARELDADLYTADNIRPGQFVAYDTIIFGGGIFAGRINGVDLIKDNLLDLLDKNVIVFATGITEPSPEVEAEIIKQNFSPAEQDQIRFFYFRGGFDYKRLNWAAKLLMRFMRGVFKAKQRKNEPLTPVQSSMLSTFEQPQDYTEQQNIAPLILAIRL